MNHDDVLPLLAASFGLVALTLGFLLLVVEHHHSPFLQKASVGVLMFAVLATIDEACRCAISERAIDWRLTLFVIGLAVGWGFRVAGHFRRRPVPERVKL